MNELPGRRPTAMAGYRAGQFLGYALRTGEGWICVTSLGMSWSKSVHRSAEDARVALRSTAHATDFDWFDTVEQLEAALMKLPESSMPAYMPEMLTAALGRWQRLSLA